MARFGIAALLLGLAGLPSFARAETILFVGNSFTAGAGSVVERFRPGTVTDLNGDGTGGIPALFKSFAGQSNATAAARSRRRGAKRRKKSWSPRPCSRSNRTRAPLTWGTRGTVGRSGRQA